MSDDLYSIDSVDHSFIEEQQIEQGFIPEKISRTLTSAEYTTLDKSLSTKQRALDKSQIEYAETFKDLQTKRQVVSKFFKEAKEREDVKKRLDTSDRNLLNMSTMLQSFMERSNKISEARDNAELAKVENEVAMLQVHPIDPHTGYRVKQTKGSQDPESKPSSPAREVSPIPTGGRRRYSSSRSTSPDPHLAFGKINNTKKRRDYINKQLSEIEKQVRKKSSYKEGAKFSRQNDALKYLASTQQVWVAEREKPRLLRAKLPSYACAKFKSNFNDCKSIIQGFLREQGVEELSPVRSEVFHLLAQEYDVLESPDAFDDIDAYLEHLEGVNNNFKSSEKAFKEAESVEQLEGEAVSQFMNRYISARVQCNIVQYADQYYVDADYGVIGLKTEKQTLIGKLWPDLVKKARDTQPWYNEIMSRTTTLRSIVNNFVALEPSFYADGRKQLTDADRSELVRKQQNTPTKRKNPEPAEYQQPKRRVEQERQPYRQGEPLAALDDPAAKSQAGLPDPKVGIMERVFERRDDADRVLRKQLARAGPQFCRLLKGWNFVNHVVAPADATRSCNYCNCRGHFTSDCKEKLTYAYKNARERR